MSTRRCGLCRREGRDRRSCPTEKKKNKEICIVKASIRSSCLSYFPTLYEKKFEIYDRIWKDSPCADKKGLGQHQYEILEIENKTRLLREWTQTLYDDIHDPKQPITKFHLHLPLSFWVAMLREVTSVIPNQYKIRIDQYNAKFSLKFKELRAAEGQDVDYYMQSVARGTFKLCDKMRKTSIDCIEKMVPETRLTLKLFPEHVRHVLSYL